MSVTPEDIECLIVNSKSEVEDLKAYLRQKLNVDIEKIKVRAFGKVKECGIE